MLLLFNRGGKAHEFLCVLNYERKVEHGSVVSIANKKQENIYIYRFIWYTNKRVLNINHCGFWRHFSNVHWFPFISISLSQSLTLSFPHFSLFQYFLLFYAEQTNIGLGIVEAFCALLFTQNKFSYLCYGEHSKSRKKLENKLNIT